MNTFTTVDYVLFIVPLVVVMGIGIILACTGGRQRTTDEIVLGNKSVSLFPVALSILASFMSAISLLGYSAEFYIFGSMLLYYAVVYVIAYPVAAAIFIPVFHRLNIKSAYEYLELRFNRTVRQTVSLLFCLKLILYLSVVLYAPSLALSSVVDLPLVVSILTTGLVAIFYTSLGGFKAVVWTSTFQMGIIVAGFLFVIVDGTMKLGGWANILSAAQSGNRLILDDVRIDPRVRHSIWSLVVGGTFTILSMLAADQLTIQRYLSFKQLRKAQIALLLNIPLCFMTLFFYCASGLIMFVTYKFCDPLLQKHISKYDQLLIYYVADQERSRNGLLGLFASAVYGAGLSTLSSGYNAVSAVILEDTIKPLYSWKTGSVLADNKGAIVTKVIVVLFGLLIIALAYCFQFLQGTVFQMALSIFGMVGGPLLGVFCLGMFFSWTNSKGAFVGLITSVMCTFFIGFQAIFTGVRPTVLPVTAAGCECQLNSTFTNCSAIYDNSSYLFRCDESCGYNVIKDNPGGITDLYRVSYQYYSLIGVIVVLVIGGLVSALTGGCRTKCPVDRRLLASWKCFRKTNSKDLFEYSDANTMSITEKKDDLKKNPEFIEKF